MVVTVEDINDVTPNFTESVYVASIIENVPPGSSITTVIANDDDAGESGAVTYTVVAGDFAIFEVDCEYSLVLYAPNSLSVYFQYHSPVW